MTRIAALFVEPEGCYACAGSEPDHYGSLHLDGPRAVRAGWTRVCEDVHSRQAFWRSR